MRFNYHTHSNYSDGYTDIDEMVRCASSNDFDIIGISDHSPVPFSSSWNMKYEKLSQYLDDIKKAKEEHSDKITVLAGMEVDFFPNLKNIAYYKSFGLDYTIGSVHYVGSFPDGRAFNVDKSSDAFLKGLEEIFGNDAKKFATAYYHLVNKMIVNDPPDIVAHITLIEKFNKKLQKLDTQAAWYQELVKESLLVLSKSDCILEINARSWYRNLLDEFVPPLWAVKEAKKLNIPITISGDIHKPQEYGIYWDDAIKFVKAAGYDELTYILPGGNREILKI